MTFSICISFDIPSKLQWALTEVKFGKSLVIWDYFGPIFAPLPPVSMLIVVPKLFFDAHPSKE